ncbi:hypothetical protein GCM10007874_47160 [Labrys miyagiensis]|uniref:Uncharacterized protein n=1 Tax=Labrys miyagiensis TaxID=346912 RepID=A0ABQ6CNI3_9HYPH|nr:hypothetical protein [Labrys miyagiensis]GLS21699.1 hypothetical protein GCM10007874_47160 [Labrys miyagiensis]
MVADKLVASCDAYLLDTIANIVSADANSRIDVVDAFGIPESELQLDLIRARRLRPEFLAGH